MTRTRRALLLVLLSLFGCSGLGPAPVWERDDDPLPGLPSVVFWAWRRSEDLRFLDPQGTGVAFLAATITLRDGGVAFEPRLQPMRAPEGAELISVVRIEAPGETFDEDQLGDNQLSETVELLESVARSTGAERFQIDFDAVESQRPFYRELLTRLRERLPAETPITITALASWCIGDGWIRDLPIEEATPMLFRMGVEDEAIRRRLADSGDFLIDLCRTSVGVSTDEPWPAFPHGRRIYVFHPRSWDERSAEEAQAQAEARQ